ncbi:MAG: acyl-ACP--UDP-N-acetylglucosamine O-acyltransferase [Gammaproteobacteria bacterium]|nr:acyl-ACP--UDP-N-acetylglucosamine O-acyltransferase [Gammaproteobacteria bacterium]
MIAKTAIIDSSARIGQNVSIGEFSVIGANVEIGDNCQISPHVVITGPTKIGQNNKILQFASVGSDPQDLKYKGEPTLLEIGDNNVIRECCTINRGTVQGGNITKIGNNNLLMAYVHVAHDCIIGNGNVMANNTSFAGHVIIDDNVLFGGFAAVGQFCHIGSYSFVAGKTAISKDVPPYVLVSGVHGETATYGLNVVGLKRRGFSYTTVRSLRKAYHIVYKEGLTVAEALQRLQEMAKECKEILLFADFIAKSEHGIIR